MKKIILIILLMCVNLFFNIKCKTDYPLIKEVDSAYCIDYYVRYKN